MENSNNNQLEAINNCLNILFQNGINESTIKEVFVKLMDIVGNQKLTGYRFVERLNNAAIFFPKNNEIEICIPHVMNWLKKNVDEENNSIFPKIENRYLLKCYLTLFIFLHEIDHANQYLIAKEEIKSPSLLVTKGYQNILLNVLTAHKYLLPRPIKLIRRAISLSIYLANNNDYILERNANIAGFLTIAHLADYRHEDTISYYLTESTKLFSKIGYEEDNKGSIYNTHKKILLLDKLPKINDYENLPTGIKIRYGLPINEEERKLIIN